MELQRENEILLIMVEKQRLMVDSLLLGVEKLQKTTQFSCNDDETEIPSLKSGNIVDKNSSVGMVKSLRKIHQRRILKSK